MTLTPSEGDSSVDAFSGANAISSAAFSAQNRDPQELLAAWSSLIESGTNRLIERAYEEINRAKIEEARRSIALRPVALNPDPTGTLMPLDDFKRAIEVKPVSIWYDTAAQSFPFDQIRTRTCSAVAIAMGQSVENAQASEPLMMLAPTLVNQLIGYEAATNTRYRDEIQLQSMLLHRRSEYIRFLQKVDLMEAINEIGPERPNAAVTRLHNVKELEPVFKLDRDTLRSERIEKVEHLNEIENNILSSNLNLLNAVIADSGSYLNLRAETLSKKALHVLARCSITEIVEAMTADTNVWPQYRAQQLDQELLTQIAKNAATQFSYSVPGAVRGTRPGPSRESQENLAAITIETFLSDAIDRLPRLSDALKRSEAYGWGFTGKLDPPKFLDFGTTSEDRRKVVCNYILTLMSRDGHQNVPTPDDVNALLKSDLGNYRQALVELTPILSMAAAIHAVTQSAVDVASANSSDTTLVEVSIPSSALYDLKRFIDLATQIEPECCASEQIEQWRTRFVADRSAAVIKAQANNQASISRVQEDIDAVAGYRTEVISLGQFQAEAKSASELEKQIDSEISELSDRRNERGIKGAIWRRTKAAQEERDLYEQKRQAVEKVEATNLVVRQQEQKLRQIASEIYDTRRLLPPERLEELDAKLLEMQREKSELEGRKFV